MYDRLNTTKYEILVESIIYVIVHFSLKRKQRCMSLATEINVYVYLDGSLLTFLINKLAIRCCIYQSFLQIYCINFSKNILTMGKRKRSKIREFAEEELPEESKDHLPPLTRNSDEYAEKKVTSYV